MEAPEDVHVDANIIPLIAFSEGCEAVKNRAVVFTLSRIAKVVELIVERFSAEF